MSTHPSEEIFQPKFAALESCLLVDPRHSSRHELKRQLKGSNLFENIVEARSLDDAERIVANHSFDACFVGSSLVLEKATALLKKLTPISFSKDTAFLAIIFASTEDTTPYSEAGAHRAIRTPSAKSIFAEEIVRGVIAANANSPWTKILADAEKAGVNLFGDPTSTDGHVAPKEGPAAESTLNSVIAKTATGLKQILKKLDDGSIAFDLAGNPDERAQQTIKALLDSILKDNPPASKAPGFREHFERALLEWLADVKVYGPSDALNELRQKLASFKP